MDESQSETPKSGNNKNILVMAIVGIIVIALVLGGGYYFLNMNKTQDNEVVESQAQSPAGEENMTKEEGASGQGVTGEPQTSNYKDGTYSAEGKYAVHAGEEQIGVKITIKNGAITDVVVIQEAKLPMSKTMQADFAANFKPMVMGKNIDTLVLGKVSGSSLTPLGFNDAVNQIKAQAKS
jgi:uncharacterized protein with FMN-binding domain